MKKNLFNIIILLSLVFIWQACNLATENISSQLFPNPPDTANLLAFSTHINPEQIAKVISEETQLRNGLTREIGNTEDPKNGDDFRDYHFDNVAWRMIQIQDGDFRGCYFRSANCDISDFSYSDFRIGNFESAKFNKATLVSCNFNQASLFLFHADYAMMDYSSFIGTNMFGIHANEASLRYCDLSNALLRDGQFADADFTGSTAVKTNFLTVLLVDAKLDSTDLSYSDFSGASMERASFVNARIHSAIFFETNLKDVDFTGADLKGCNFIGAGFWNTIFKDAINIPESLKSQLVDDKYTGVLTK